MTDFFATPRETSEWLHDEAERVDAVLHEDPSLSGSPRVYVWPRDAPSLPPPVRGVQVWCPEEADTVLTQGNIAWQASAFDEETAATGRRLARGLRRSLRKRATVPLYAMSLDGTTISAKPLAWGTPAAWAAG